MIVFFATSIINSKTIYNLFLMKMYYEPSIYYIFMLLYFKLLCRMSLWWNYMLLIWHISGWNYMSGFNHIYSRLVFLYISFLEHIKVDHNLIHVLIEWWRCEIYTFHLRHEEMTPTLQDIAILLGFLIDAHTITYIRVCN
jgi:hypothetical protein